MIGRAKWYKILAAVIIQAIVVFIMLLVLWFISDALGLIPVAGGIISLIISCFLIIFIYIFMASYWAKFFAQC